MYDFEIIKTIRLINKLINYRCNGLNMLSLVVPPTMKIEKLNNLLNEDFEDVSNLKSKSNKKSMYDLLVTARLIVSYYKEIPKNGLIIYCGNVNEDNNVKKIGIHFEPFLKITEHLYVYDNVFHTDTLQNLLYRTNDKIEFVIMENNTVSIYKHHKTETSIIHTFIISDKYNENDGKEIKKENLSKIFDQINKEIANKLEYNNIIMGIDKKIFEDNKNTITTNTSLDDKKANFFFVVRIEDLEYCVNIYN